MEFSQALEEIQKDSVAFRPDYLFSIYHLTALLPQPFTAVEIGCYKGDSTMALLAGIGDECSKIFSIDPVFIDGEILVPDEHNKDGILYKSTPHEVKNRLTRVGDQSRVSLIPEYSNDFLKKWPYGQVIDYLLVDGAHTYEAVQLDCQWMEFVKLGGIAAFDDWFAEISLSVHDYVASRPEWVFLHESTNGHLPNGFNLTTLRKSS